MLSRTLVGACLVVALAAPSARAQVFLGYDATTFSGPGWGHWDTSFVSGLTPDAAIGTEPDLMSDAIVITKEPLDNTVAYNAGFAFGNTKNDFLANDQIEFDVIFFTTGGDTDTGFHDIREVSFNYGQGFQGLRALNGLGTDFIVRQGYGQPVNDQINGVPITLDYSGLPSFYDANGGAGPTFLQVIFNTRNQVNNTTNEAIYIDNVRLTNSQFITQLTAAEFDAGPAFTFGQFNDPGAVDTTSGNIVIDSTHDPLESPSNGGITFQSVGASFEETKSALQIRVKKTADNTAERFSLVLRDVDGVDMAGATTNSEEWRYGVFLADVEEDVIGGADDFEIITIPLGTGTESALAASSGVPGPGDGIQNFDLGLDLDRVSLQSVGDPEMNRLNIEVESIRVIELEDGLGEYNGDTTINALDYLSWRESFGDTGVGLDADGDDDGRVENDDFLIFRRQFGFTTPPPPVLSGVTVPEPASMAMVLAAVAGLGASRRRGR